jgi:CHASE3 domain sensor protein
MKRLARTITPRTAITVCTIGLPAIVLLIGVLLAQQTLQNDATTQAVNHSAMIRMRLQRVFSLLQDAETGQRGYLLTSQERYLEPYTEAAKQLGPQMSRLATMLQPDPEQRAKLAHLQIAVSRKMAELDKTVALNRRWDHESAMAIVLSGTGLVMMDDARKITTDIQAAQDRELTAQMAKRATGYARTSWFVGVLLSALALLIGFSALVAILNYEAGKKVIADVRR